MMSWYQNDWSGAAVLGMVTMLAVWGVLVGIAIWAIARFTRSDRPPAQELETPRVVLDRRFAAGDIDAESYAQARRILDLRSRTDSHSRGN